MGRIETPGGRGAAHMAASQLDNALLTLTTDCKQPLKWCIWCNSSFNLFMVVLFLKQATPLLTEGTVKSLSPDVYITGLLAVNTSSPPPLQL